MDDPDEELRRYKTPKIIVSPAELAQFEHVAFDGEHPTYGDHCPVCSGHTDYTTGLIEDFAVMAFPESPLARRREQQDRITEMTQ